MKKKHNLTTIVYYIVLITLIMSIFYVSFRIFAAPVASEDTAVRTKSSYALMLVQCFLGLAALSLPDMFAKKFLKTIPSNMLILYFIFLYCAIYLGEVRDFYYRYNSWDTILHMFSGGMLGTLGFSFVTLLNKTDKIPMNLSPFFVAMFAFCFAITIGVFWEIYEFSFDGLLHLNMQKFMTEDGIMFVGREALRDTMEDLIVDGIGAFIISSIGYISLKYKTKFIEKFSFLPVNKQK